MTSPSPARVTVFGLGTFGGQIAVARFFARAGSRVTVTDKKPREKLEGSVAELEGLGVRFVLGEHRDEDFVATDLVVRSPAVPPSHELVAKALAAGVPVVTEIELTLSRLRAPYAAVTGTKGKSTTTALLGAMLKERHGKVHVGGNIGRPLLEEADSIPESDPVVLELSSFMAEDLALARARGEKIPSPRLLAITSLAPEHLDRHGTKDAYYGAKLSLMDSMGRDGSVVYSKEGELGPLVEERAAARKSDAPRLFPVFFDGGEGSEGSFAFRKDDAIVETRSGETLFLASELSLPGEHNVRNATLAALSAKLQGCGPEAIRRAIRAFRPLPHRLETVFEDKDGRLYVDDSIATTPEAASAALAAFSGKHVVLLLGGSDKGSDLTGLARDAAAKAFAVVCLGATGKKIASLVLDAVKEQRGKRLYPPTVVHATAFADAFEIARKMCPEKGIVLLSPACASYDQFRNFEERGETFAALARRGP